MEQRDKRLAFKLRVIQNHIKTIIHRNVTPSGKGPHSQLQGGILGYLYHHQEQPVYQRDIEKEFRVSGATATNTLQLMEKNGLIVRRAVDRDARLKRIQMTEEALRDHMQIEEQMELLDRRMTAGMTPQEEAELHRLLDLVFWNLDEIHREQENGVPGRADTGEEKRERKCDRC